MASNTQDVLNSAQSAPTIAVGQSLMTARELLGKEIGEVAAQLRIRQPFLQALEDGRHKDLPGGTYAVGFLRTYAEFLGLDGEEMVRRFRAEAAGDLDARSELLFPSPVSEGRIPGGAVLFLGLIFAGIAYGGWYWLSSRQSEITEMVPPLPERLASVLNRQATLTGDAVKPAPAPKPDEALPKADGQPAAMDEKDGEPTAMGGKDHDMVPPSEGDEDVKQPEPVKPEPVKPELAKAGLAKPEPVKLEAPKPAPAEAAKQPEAPPPAAPASVPAAPPPAAPVPDGKVIGQEHTDSRIKLKATGDDCWVQVREMDGQLLLSRLLRRGDVYMVPNRPGLSLMVGNAGALEILVDGKAAPSLGATGQVRRDIKLDADKLGAAQN